MNVTKRLRPWLAAAGMTALLAACGGGGGDDAAANAGPVLEAPPATAAVLQTTDAEAGGAAAAAVQSAQRLVQWNASLDGSIPAFANGGSMAMSLSRAALSATRERALATQTVTCADFFGSSSCSGSLKVDSNFTDSGTVIPAGTYATMTFSALQGSFGGSPVRVDGKLRIDYLSAFDTNASSLAGLSVQMTFTNFSGTSEGVSFGPLTEVARYEFDNRGASQMTVDGLKIYGLDTLTVTDADNYRLPDVGVRRAHWAAPTAYIDTQFTNWSVVNGRPAVGSEVGFSAGASDLFLTVTASSAGAVQYAVSAFTNDVLVATYTVTATYPAGGGAPTYTVVATPI